MNLTRAVVYFRTTNATAYVYEAGDSYPLISSWRAVFATTAKQLSG